VENAQRHRRRLEPIARSVIYHEQIAQSGAAVATRQRTGGGVQVGGHCARQEWKDEEMNIGTGGGRDWRQRAGPRRAVALAAAPAGIAVLAAWLAGGLMLWRRGACARSCR
jgi:hypothetical protein